MRLHRLTLRHVKGVAERTVELPETGVVVLEGPNEVGKTTMLEAFDALLTKRCTSKAADVRAMQPVGEDVGPFVEAELTLGGRRLRYAKRWLRQPSATLHLLGDRPEQLTGDAAQERMQQLLDQHLDSTLWDALRLSQSGDGAVASLGSSTVLAEALDAAAGAHLHAPGAEALLAEVEQEYRLYYTPTGRPTGDYRVAMARWTAAQDDLVEAHRRFEAGLELVRRWEAAVTHAEVTQVDLVAAEGLAEAAEAAGARAELVAEAHDRARSDRDRVDSLLRAARREAEARRGLVADREARAAALVAERERRDSDLAAAAGLQEQLVAVEAAAEEAEGRVEVASTRLELARARADRLAAHQACRAAEEELRRTTELVERLAAARTALPGHQVDHDLARRLRARRDRIDGLMLRHAVASPTLRVETEAATAVVTAYAADGAEIADGRTELGPGAEHRLVAAYDTTIELPGHGRVRLLLREDAHERLAEIDREKLALARELTQIGVEHVDELEPLADQLATARQALRDAERDVQVLVRPLGRAAVEAALRGEVPTAVTTAVDEARGRLAELDDIVQARTREGSDGGESDGGEAGSGPLATGIREEVDLATVELRAATSERARCLSAREDARARVRTLTAHLDRAAGSIQSAENGLGDLDRRLAAARGEASDADLAASVAARSAELAAAEEALTASSRAMLEADVAGARQALDSARHRLRLARQAHATALADAHALGGQVELTAGEGHQELLDLAEAALDEAQRDLVLIDRRARAAKHLFTTLTSHRNEAHRSYVRPYTQALEELGRRVYGEDFQVTVDDHLTLLSRTLGGVTVPFTDLSGGAKEQLGILARLAVARLVDPTQGVPVVIDDALGYTDPQRLRQMGAVLGTASDDEHQLQVILLTCTPRRYAEIPHVSTISLTA